MQSHTLSTVCLLQIRGIGYLQYISNQILAFMPVLDKEGLKVLERQTQCGRDCVVFVCVYACICVYDCVADCVCVCVCVCLDLCCRRPGSFGKPRKTWQSVGRMSEHYY